MPTFLDQYAELNEQIREVERQQHREQLNELKGRRAEIAMEIFGWRAGDHAVDQDGTHYRVEAVSWSPVRNNRPSLEYLRVKWRRKSDGEWSGAARHFYPKDLHLLSKLSEEEAAEAASDYPAADGSWPEGRVRTISEGRKGPQNV